MAPIVRREKGQKNKQDGCVRGRLQPSPIARLSSFPSPSIITLFTRIASPVCALWGLIRSYVCDGRAAEQESCCCWCVSCYLFRWPFSLFLCVCCLLRGFKQFQTPEGPPLRNSHIIRPQIPSQNPLVGHAKRETTCARKTVDVYLYHTGLLLSSAGNSSHEPH